MKPETGFKIQKLVVRFFTITALFLTTAVVDSLQLKSICIAAADRCPSVEGERKSNQRAYTTLMNDDRRHLVVA